MSLHKSCRPGAVLGGIFTAAHREQAGGVGISGVVQWKAMESNWDGKNRKDLEEEGKETE